MNLNTISVIIAGRINCINNNSSNRDVDDIVGDIVCQAIRGPTRPDVPMPAPTGLFVIFRTTVETGPSIALATIGGIHMTGFFIIFGTYNIDVPKPLARAPFNPLTW